MDVSIETLRFKRKGQIYTDCFLCKETCWQISCFTLKNKSTLTRHKLKMNSKRGRKYAGFLFPQYLPAVLSLHLIWILDHSEAPIIINLEKEASYSFRKEFNGGVCFFKVSWISVPDASIRSGKGSQKFADWGLSCRLWNDEQQAGRTFWRLRCELL